MLNVYPQQKARLWDQLKKNIQIDGFDYLHSGVSKSNDGVRVLRTRQVVINTELDNEQPTTTSDPPSTSHADRSTRKSTRRRTPNHRFVIKQESSFCTDDDMNAANANCASRDHHPALKDEIVFEPVDVPATYEMDVDIKSEIVANDDEDAQVDAAKKVIVSRDLVPPPCRFVIHRPRLGRRLLAQVWRQHFRQQSFESQSPVHVLEPLDLLIRWDSQHARLFIRHRSGAHSSSSSSLPLLLSSLTLRPSSSVIDRINADVDDERIAYLHESQLRMDTLPPFILTEQTVTFDYSPSVPQPPIVETFETVDQLVDPLSSVRHVNSPVEPVEPAKVVELVRKNIVLNRRSNDSVKITIEPVNPIASKRPPSTVEQQSQRGKVTLLAAQNFASDSDSTMSAFDESDCPNVPIPQLEKQQHGSTAVVSAPAAVASPVKSFLDTLRIPDGITISTTTSNNANKSARYDSVHNTVNVTTLIPISAPAAPPSQPPPPTSSSQPPVVLFSMPPRKKPRKTVLVMKSPNSCSSMPVAHPSTPLAFGSRMHGSTFSVSTSLSTYQHTDTIDYTTSTEPMSIEPAPSSSSSIALTSSVPTATAKTKAAKRTAGKSVAGSSGGGRKVTTKVAGRMFYKINDNVPTFDGNVNPHSCDNAKDSTAVGSPKIVESKHPTTPTSARAAKPRYAFCVCLFVLY